MSDNNLELFTPPLLPGLQYRDDVVSPAQEDLLIAHMLQLDLAPFRFQGWLGKRLTASFGWHYDFDTGSFGETHPLPEWLLPLRKQAAAFAQLQPDELVQASLIQYDPGAGIGWHKDRSVFEHVIGISLGNAATMRFRRRRDKRFSRFATPLARRSIYHLSGETRHDWEHSIAPMDVPRWSVTFRSLASRCQTGPQR